MAVKCTNLPKGIDTVKALPPALLTEFLGTFFLVFTVYLTVAQGAFLAPLAIGTSLAVMVYMGGHISGAHYNPAVTFGLAMSMRADKLGLTWAKVVLYVAAQVTAGCVAALIGFGLTGSGAVWSPAPGTRGIGPALVAEVLYTFALVSVVLNVATSKTSEVPNANGDSTTNAFFGFAIGMTVFVGAVSVGQISGCVLNPAVGTGIILVHSFFGGGMKAFGMIWLYWVGPMTGGALAAAVYYLTNPKEYAEAAAVKKEDPEKEPEV